MKILFVQDTDWITRYPGQQHHLAERLSLRGHDITVIDFEILWQTTGEKQLFSKRQVFRSVSKLFDDANITVIRPGILKIPLLEYVSMLVTYGREIARQMEESPPDVVVSHSILTNYLAMRAAKKRGIPFVFHLTDAQHRMIPSRVLQPLGKMIESAVFKSADRVVTINEELKEYAIGMGARPERALVIRAGIDAERYRPDLDGCVIRERYGIEPDETVLFFMGWLYHFSGLKEVLSELAKRKKTNPKTKLLIVGDGEARDELVSLRNDYDLQSHVILTGKKPYDEIPELVAAADVCLLPAYNNSIMRDIVPIKMYEYMAMGKPVIATRLPGITKEFGNDNGVLYVEGPQDVLNKAAELIRTGAIHEQGEKARQFVQNNDWSRVVDEFEKVLIEGARLNKDDSIS